MNEDTAKTFSEDNISRCKPSKKSKKKKRRTKNKLYNLRLKRQKRKSNFLKQSFKPFEATDSRRIMSNWYWSNYKKAVEWRDKHELAHWKSCALALQEENKYLLRIINQIRPNFTPDVSVTSLDLEKERCRNRVNSFNVSNSDDTEDHEEQESDDDIEFEMSEEMIEFFRQSMKHKESLKKTEEEKSVKKAEEEIKQLQMNKLKRNAEMQLLYGEGASVITGMETAVQLSYEKFCDTKSPKYWPNIPFRL